MDGYIDVYMHGRVHLFIKYCLWLIYAIAAELNIAAETLQSRKTQIFTIWLFTEKVC